MGWWITPPTLGTADDEGGADGRQADAVVAGDRIEHQHLLASEPRATSLARRTSPGLIGPARRRSIARISKPTSANRCRLLDHRLHLRFRRRQHVGRARAEFDEADGLARHDVGRVGQDLQAADGGVELRSRAVGQALQRDDEVGGGEQRVVALGHRRWAGVGLLADEGHAIFGGAPESVECGEAQARFLQLGGALDVQFEVGVGDRRRAAAAVGRCCRARRRR